MRKIATALALLSVGSSFGAVLEDFSTYSLGTDPDPREPNLSEVIPASPWSTTGNDGFAVYDETANDVGFGNIGGRYATNFDSGTSASTRFNVPASTLALPGTGTPFPYATLTVNFALYDSTVGDPTRNTFGISYDNSVGGDLGITFVPTALGSWEVFYNTGAGPITSNIILPAEGLATLTFIFEEGRINATMGAGNVFYDIGISDAPAGYADGANVDDEAGLVFSVEGANLGDNFMYVQAIETYTAVPEASTALLGAIGALGLLRRRRSH